MFFFFFDLEASDVVEDSLMPIAPRINGAHKRKPRKRKAQKYDKADWRADLPRKEVKRLEQKFAEYDENIRSLDENRVFENEDFDLTNETFIEKWADMMLYTVLDEKELRRLVRKFRRLAIREPDAVSVPVDQSLHFHQFVASYAREIVNTVVPDKPRMVYAAKKAYADEMKEMNERAGFIYHYPHIPFYVDAAETPTLTE